MSYSIDVNVLLYASDQASPFNAKAVRTLKDVASQKELLCLTWGTIMGYLRISTHSCIFTTPLTPEEAMHNIEALLRLPNVRVLTEQEDFWSLYRETASMVTARGNLVPDIFLASLLRQHGIKTLYTNDADFKKFPFLSIINPFDVSQKSDRIR